MKRMATAAFTMLLGLFPNLLWAQPDFYRGKLITLVQDSTPGGVGQLRTQALIPVLQKHIPGNPRVVVQFMQALVVERPPTIFTTTHAATA